MKFEWNRRDSTIAAYSFIVLALAVAFYHILANLQAVNDWVYNLFYPIFPLFYGFIIAYLLNPVLVYLERLSKKIKFTSRLRPSVIRSIALLLTYLTTTAIIVIFGFIVLPEVFRSVKYIASQMHTYVSSAEQFARGLVAAIPESFLQPDAVNQFTDMVGQAVRDFISLLGNSIPQMLGVAYNIGTIVFRLLIGLIISAYLLYSKEKFMGQLRKLVCAFLPRRRVARMSSIARTTDLMFGRFITGKIIDSIIIGILCYIGMVLMRMPNTVLVSFIIGITNLLPFFGPFLGAIPSFFLIAFISPTQAVVFLLFVLALQQLDGNIIGPMILGDSTGLSPMWVVFAILFFGGAFGFIGMFIGVPTFAVIYWIIKNKIVQHLAEKDMPTCTAEYMQPLSDYIPSNKKKNSKPPQ
jgi:predicted PurR-regulated permease PerM